MVVPGLLSQTKCYRNYSSDCLLHPAVHLSRLSNQRLVTAKESSGHEQVKIPRAAYAFRDKAIGPIAVGSEVVDS